MAITLPDPISERVKSVLEIALLIHQASAPGPSAQKGSEREVFVNYVLKEGLPPTIRFGTGSVSDLKGNESGQLDIVLEGNAGVSFSMPGVPNSRFYLANYVGAVIEVKSNLESSSWTEATDSAAKLAQVRRDAAIDSFAKALDDPMRFTSHDGRTVEEAQEERLRSAFRNHLIRLDAQPTHIPFYVVGYKGWKRHETLQTHLGETECVDGAFIIENGLWAFKNKRQGPVFGGSGHAQLVNFMTRLLKDCQQVFESADAQFTNAD